MSKKKTPGIIEDIAALAKANSRGQVGLADEIGVSPSRISEYIAGKRVPSSDVLWKLGKLAPFPMNLRFWEQAGLSKEDILAAARAIGESRLIRPEQGTMILVPRFRETEHGREEAGPPVPLPAEFIPNPLATICLSVDEDSSGFASAPRGLFILDTSISGTRNVAAHEGRVVAVYMPESAEGRHHGLYVGRLKVDLRTNSRQPERVGFVAYLLPLVFRPRSEEIGVPSWLLPLTAEALFKQTIEIGSCGEPEGLSGLDREDYNKVHERLAEIWSRMGQKFPLNERVRIVGRVIGRLTGHLEKPNAEGGGTE